MGAVLLETNKQLTLATVSGVEFGVVRKKFGCHATPSLNAQLPAKRLQSTLVRDQAGREHEFERYLKDENKYSSHNLVMLRCKLSRKLFLGPVFKNRADRHGTIYLTPQSVHAHSAPHSMTG